MNVYITTQGQKGSNLLLTFRQFNWGLFVFLYSRLFATLQSYLFLFISAFLALMALP